MMLICLCGIWLGCIATLVALYHTAPEMDFEVLTRGVVPRIRRLQALRQSGHKPGRTAQAINTVTFAGDSEVLGFWRWNAQTDLVRASNDINSVFGIRSDLDECDVPLRLYESRVHPDDLDWLRREQPQCFGPSGLGVIEYRVVDGAGQTRWIMFRGLHRTDGRGQLVSAEGVMLDVTAFKTDGTDIRTAPAPLPNAMFQAADALIRAHAAAVQTGSHELVFQVEAALLKVGHALAAEQITVRGRPAVRA